jgi:hypothetical protein
LFGDDPKVGSKRPAPTFKPIFSIRWEEDRNFYFHLNPEIMLKTMLIVAVSIAILIELTARRTRQHNSLISTP